MCQVTAEYPQAFPGVGLLLHAFSASYHTIKPYRACVLLVLAPLLLPSTRSKRVQYLRRGM